MLVKNTNKGENIIMQKLILFFTFLCLFKSEISAQLFGNSTFTLDGKINIDTGKILMLPVGEDIYYPKKEGFQQASIIDGKFNFSGNILYPYAFRLMVRNTRGYISDIFLIDSGIQKINCHIDSLRKIPDIINNSILEEKGNFYNTFIYVNKELSESVSSKEYDNLIYKKDSLLLEYTKKYPSSFVALWTLIDKLSNGYEPIYDSIYSQLSITIKQTYTGQILADKLKASSSLVVGKTFPRLELLNAKMQKEKLPIKSKNKYTLIDFWFSHCNPCISEFNQLKSIYRTFNNKGFDIIAISVDKKEDITNWEKIIKEYRLPWNQCLDIGGQETIKFSIDAFPTNFLLNEKGEIIRKNISPDELEIFLTKIQ